MAQGEKPGERGGTPGARGGVALMHFTAAMSGGWSSKASEVATGLLIPPALLFSGIKSSRRHRH